MLLQERKPGPTRLCGVLVVLAALAVGVCLGTYNHAEMGWGLLNPGHAEEAAAVPCTNALGVLGLYVAGILYWAFGSCAYYAAFLALLLGICILVHPRRPMAGQILAMLIMLVLACAVMNVQTDFLQEWAQRHPSGEAGGMLGYLDGTLVAGRLMPQHIALAVLIALHGIAMVYAARLNFRDIFHQVWADTKAFFSWLGERWSLHRQHAAARRELRRQRAEDKARRKAAEAARRAVLEAREEEDADSPQASPSLPPRQKSGLQGRRNVDDEDEDDEDAPPASIEEQLRQHSMRRGGEEMQPPPSSRGNRRAGGRGNDMHPVLPNLLDMMQGPDEPAPKPSARPAERRKPKPRPKPAPKKPEIPDYPFPPYDMLKYEPVPPEVLAAAEQEMEELQKRLIETFATFNIEVQPGPITRGPSITRYEFYPPSGMRVGQFDKLQRDLMLATSSASVNILAPVPGKNTIGIELANRTKSPVYLRELLESPAFRNPKLRIPVALGKDVYGNTVIGDLAAMPHTLVAGTTGSGKSVCINSMILSMLYKFRPDELRLVLVDPKVVEMQPYRKLPHLACPVVTNPARVIGALRWAVNEMEHRYRLFSRIGVRNFEDFNSRDISNDPTGPEEDFRLEDPEEARQRGEELADEILASNESRGGEIDEQAELGLFDEESEPIPAKLPYIVIIIDELADLMQVVKEDLEAYIARLTQKARAAGIHLVAATQTPRASVVTGLIKANIPSRIAFRVASNLDSRVILDTNGAENLLGQGDCLFLPPGGVTKMTRAQGAFVTDAEIGKIIAFCAAHAKQNFDQAVSAEMNNAESSVGKGGATSSFGGGGGGDGGGGDDDLYARCVSFVATQRKASTSLLQRHFSIGYGRAAKIMDMMEERGVISPPQGATRAREVLIENPQ
ncbi:MAG: DNA translocase FtsK [Akkermansia sp.]|nr:DNA translocase FtsK [Akkermansia sp.]